MQISANKQKILLTLVSFSLFYFLSHLAFNLGADFGEFVMQENFGPPTDLYPILFGTVMFFTAVLFGLCGLIITVIFMHQLGRRFKISVGKLTLYGFLLYLLTIVRIIIIDNLNKVR